MRDQLQAALGASYTIESELGGGGMSRVFVATETALGRRVVVKVLPPELAAAVNVERFRREIQLAARLQQPNIVPIHAAGETGGLPYYTMPLVDGHSLRRRLSSTGPLPITEVIGVLRDVAKALAYAHERGIVHRDIKPDNVLLSGGSAVVTDFGVAKALSASKDALPGGTLTQVGSSLGTPAYMAPEQAAADPTTDHRADLYALGVMAYEMLAGRPPFHGRTPQKLLAAQMAERPVPIGEVRADTPPVLAELVMQCLEKEPDHRPQSAADIVRVLETVTSGGSHAAMPAILLGGRRPLGRMLLLYAVACVSVAIVAKAAIIAIGLPNWVFPGAVLVMALGLPVILFTAFVHHGAYQAMTMGALTPGGSPAVQSTMTRLAVKASPWVSWRRTAMGGVVAVAGFAVLVLAFMAMRVLGIGPAGTLLAAGKINDRERLLVTDFRAPGADTSLGGIVTEALRTDLSQSSVISIASPNTVSDALARMQRPATSRVDLALAREIATRDGIKAVVDGDVNSLAGGYLITVRLVRAEDGDELASYHTTVDSPRELIPGIDKLARDLRAKIGESLKAVRANPPLEQVTTASLDALRKYVEGARANDADGDYPKAVQLLEAAVALDTTFAMAYRKLGVAMNNAGLPTAQANAALARAYRYRGRLTERERYLAMSAYFNFGPGYDRAQAASAYEILLARDSLDPVAGPNLGFLEATRRKFATAEALERRASNANRNANSLQELAIAQVDAGRLDAADSTLARIRRDIPGSPLIAVIEFVNLYARGRLDAATALYTHVLATEQNTVIRSFAMRSLADLATVRGHLSEAEHLSADADAQDVSRGAPPNTLAAPVRAATMDIWFREQPARGVRTLDSALARTPPRTLPEDQRPYLDVASLYALAGRPDRAHAVLAQFAAEMKDSALIRSLEPDRHNALGEIALAERRPVDAVNEFTLGDRLPDGPASECGQCILAHLGRAYDAANMTDSAIMSYERYIATPSSVKITTDRRYLAGIHKRLGELYEAKGDRERATGHYLEFVQLWNAADPELQPKVAEAKRRLAALGRSTRD